MSQDQVDEQVKEQFWNMTDALLERANSFSEDADAGRIAEALMYAAARFNAYYVASTCEDRNDFKADRESSESVINEQFQKMLGANLDDYTENFKIYMRDE